MSDAFDILDGNIDDLMDWSGFQPILGGKHRVKLSCSIDGEGKTSRARVSMELLETLELANSEETAQEPGHKSSTMYNMYKKADGSPNQIGQGQLKQILKALRPTFGGDTPREILANSEGAECIVVLKVRVDRNDADNKSNEIKSIEVAA